MNLARTWFMLPARGQTERVERGLFAATGFGLMTLKYAVEAALIYVVTGARFTPLHYLNPVYSLRTEELTGAPEWLLYSLTLWTLPFLWVAIVLSVKRSLDAGMSPWNALLLFVPILNYVFMLTMTFVPSAEDVDEDVAIAREAEAIEAADKVRPVLLAMVYSGVIGLALVALNVYLLEHYTTSLFMATPFLIGAVSAYAANRPVGTTIGRSLGVTFLNLTLCAGLMLLFALEGIVCLAMAFPIGVALGFAGALLGHFVAVSTAKSAPPAAWALVVLPVSSGAEVLLDFHHEGATVTTIEIDAPPAVVWEHLVETSELPPPTGFLAWTGIAYPVRARLVGEGVGAVRHCEFSTGAFVEPITIWDPPTRLAFDVESQPPPMEEWSFYEHVDAPHLVDGLVSRRGEFRLEALEGGRTRLVGTTWWTLEMRPFAYWEMYTDYLIHGIHRRVMDTIRADAEAAALEDASN